VTLFATRHRGLAEDLDRLERSLGSDATVLLLGAPGTGKDRLARLLHERSPRAAEPFVRIDLASLSDDLFESELFGHERGAFTGAVSGKPGLLEGAGRGTIYLDRIDVLTPRAQGKLLRVLEERVVRRVGGTRETGIEARFVASAAARAVLRGAGGPRDLTSAAKRALRTHSFRGSFRELENVLARAALEARAAGVDAVDEPHLGLANAAEPEEFLAAASRRGWTLRHLTDSYVALVLAETGGNVAEAARRLGVARKTLYARKK